MYKKRYNQFVLLRVIPPPVPPSLPPSLPPSHVLPTSPLFSGTKERIQCAVSTLCMLVAGVLIYVGLEGGAEGGLARIGSMYLIPLLVFNAWITMVTYLQHHDEDTKVYAEGEWSYVMGALETIDREYGMGIDGEGGREEGREEMGGSKAD
jgi:fatty acid desaturase